MASPAMPRNDAADRYSPQMAEAFSVGGHPTGRHQEVGRGAGHPDPAGPDDRRDDGRRR